MPCNSDYLESSGWEKQLSRVACLLDELNGIEINPHHWNGYHPDVYNKTDKVHADKLVETLCSKLQTVDVTKYSLEMQIWWRDHQKADRDRLEKQNKGYREAKEKRRKLYNELKKEFEK